MNTPDSPGYYWFKGTGMIFTDSNGPDDSTEDPPITEIHGIVTLTWWFSHMEPYMGADYISPSSMNGIWSEALVSPFETEEEAQEEIFVPAEVTVHIDRTTLAIIQDMALNYFDPAAGKRVLDWVHSVDDTEELDD